MKSIRSLVGAVVLLCAVLPASARAQSCPNTTPGFTAGGSVFQRIASQWNQYFSAKVDAVGGVLCNPTIQGGNLASLGLGSAAGKAASGGGGTVASVLPPITTGHMAVFSDPNGTVADGGPVPNINVLVPAVVVSGNAALAALCAQTAGCPPGIAAYPGGVWRISPGGPLFFRALTGNCATNALPTDGATCVNTTAGDGNAWAAKFSGNIRVVDFGVDPGVSQSINTPAMVAALTAGFNFGLPVDLCVGGASAVTVKINPVAFYGGMHIKPCAATMFQAQQAGATFHTMPTPTSTEPGLSYVTPLIIDDGLNVDQNNQEGTPLLVEGFWGSRIGTTITHNVGTTTWVHDDGVNPTGTYLSAAMTIKTISTTPGTGAYYTEIGPPNWIQGTFSPNTGPAAIVGGVGLLLVASEGDATPRPNVTRMTGGHLHGFAKGIFIQAGGDLTVRNTDLSENTIGAQVGDPTGYNVPIPRAVFDHPYLESTALAPEYIGIWFTSNAQYGRLYGRASVSVVGARCLNDNVTQDNQCNASNIGANENLPQGFLTAGAGTYTPDTTENGTFKVTLVGGGGPGGGCGASDATHNCIGGGGAPGGLLAALCADPEQLNFRGASYTVGAGSPGTTSVGSAGGATTFTGAIPPFSGGGTWALPDWQAGASYTHHTDTKPTSFITPTVGNAGAFTFAAITDGVAGGSHPTWPQVPGQTVADGTATLENIGPSVWTAGMTTFVDTTLAYPLGTLIGPPVSGAPGPNAGRFFYMAVLPGVTGGSPPTWSQALLATVQDGTTLWKAGARSISLTAVGGAAGPASGASTTSIQLNPGALATNAIVGCRTLSNSPGAPGSSATFDIGSGYGHTGGGGSTPGFGGGGLPRTITNTSTQQIGNNGVGSGAAGGGAVSALNTTGASQVGGSGQDGAVIIEGWPGSIP